MKQVTMLMVALVTTLMLLAAACGGDGDTEAPTSKPAATSVPAGVAGPTATPVSAEPTPTPAFPTSTAFAMQGLRANLDISVEGDALEFNRGIINIRGGSPVTLTFANVSTTFSHIWVLVKDGTGEAVAERGASHPTTDWLEPDDPDVIANTKLLNPGETGSVQFPAPLQGRYQFLCTFPGHSITMTGTFRVAA